MRRMLLVLTLATGLILVGCGDDDGTDSAEPAAGATTGEFSTEGGCAVLSEDEVAEATGAEVGGATELPTGCQWSVAGDDPSASYEWQSVPVEGFESNRELAETSSGFDLMTVDGLGDEAFQRNQVTGAGDVAGYEIWVRVGDDVFFVRSAGLPASDEVLAGQEALAGLLVDRV
jgi:hypothetical protein